MARAPYRVLVIPFAIDAFVEHGYALFRDRDEAGGGWRALTGDGRRGEAPGDTAARLGLLHAGIAPGHAYVALDSRSNIPVKRGFVPALIAQHAFAVQVDPSDLDFRAECEHCWLTYEVAVGLLGPGERDALWELRWRRGPRAACR